MESTLNHELDLYSLNSHRLNLGGQCLPAYIILQNLSRMLHGNSFLFQDFKVGILEFKL
jgi:hypothetical protein